MWRNLTVCFLKWTESRAICRHIVEKYAERGNKYLLGRDLLERASIEQWLKSEERSFNPPSWDLVFHLAFNIEPDRALITKSERRLSKVLDVYEQRLGVSKFLAGDEFSLADLYHLPNSHYIARSREWGYLFESRKNVSKWWEEISSQYSWQEVVKILNEVGLLEEVEVRSNGGYQFLVHKKLQLHLPTEEQKPLGDLTDQGHLIDSPLSTGKSIVQKSITTPQSSLQLVFDPSSQNEDRTSQPMNIVDSVKQSVTPQGEKEQQTDQADTVNKSASEQTTTKEASTGVPSSRTKHVEQAHKEDSSAKSSAKEAAPDDQSATQMKTTKQLREAFLAGLAAGEKDNIGALSLTSSNKEENISQPISQGDTSSQLTYKSMKEIAPDNQSSTQLSGNETRKKQEKKQLREAFTAGLAAGKEGKKEEPIGQRDTSSQLTEQKASIDAQSSTQKATTEKKQSIEQRVDKQGQTAAQQFIQQGPTATISGEKQEQSAKPRSKKDSVDNLIPQGQATTDVPASQEKKETSQQTSLANSSSKTTAKQGLSDAKFPTQENSDSKLLPQEKKAEEIGQDHVDKALPQQFTDDSKSLFQEKKEEEIGQDHIDQALSQQSTGNSKSLHQEKKAEEIGQDRVDQAISQQSTVDSKSVPQEKESEEIGQDHVDQALSKKSTADSKSLPGEKKTEEIGQDRVDRALSQQSTADSKSLNQEKKAEEIGQDRKEKAFSQQATADSKSLPQPPTSGSQSRKKQEQVDQQTLIQKATKEERDTKLTGQVDNKPELASQLAKIDRQSSPKQPTPGDQSTKTKQDAAQTSQTTPSAQTANEGLTDGKLSSQQGTATKSLSEKKEENTQTTGADYKGQSADQKDTGKGNSSNALKSTDAKLSSQQGALTESLSEKKEENKQRTGADNKDQSANQQDSGEVNSSNAPTTDALSSQQDAPSESLSEKKEENTKTTGADTKGQSVDQQHTGEVNSSNAPKSTESTSKKDPGPYTDSQN